MSENHGNILAQAEQTKMEKHPPTVEDKLSIEQEIECPRCHDLMFLHSEFDRLCYLCEECNFSLALIN
jgi:hypothetical protein